MDGSSEASFVFDPPNSTFAAARGKDFLHSKFPDLSKCNSVQEKVEKWMFRRLAREHKEVEGSIHQWDSVSPSPSTDPLERLRLFCGIWNLHGNQPDDDACQQFLHPEVEHDIYAIGTCECGTSSEKAVFFSDKSFWEKNILSSLGASKYAIIGTKTMAALHLIVFANKETMKRLNISLAAQDAVPTGVGNIVGNKGGVIVQLGITSKFSHLSGVPPFKINFVNVHFAAHQKKVESRNHHYERVMTQSGLMKGGDTKKGTLIETADVTFLMGDTNFRVDGLAREQVDAHLKLGDAPHLLNQHDQLGRAMRKDWKHKKLVIGWDKWNEAQITFPPTYKFDLNSNEYDSSSKMRIPSWTDRILWLADPSRCIVQCSMYQSVVSLLSSDHRPVFAQFKLSFFTKMKASQIFDKYQQQQKSKSEDINTCAAPEKKKFKSEEINTYAAPEKVDSFRGGRSAACGIM